MAEGRANSGGRKSGPVSREQLLQQLLEESADLQRRSAELAARVKELQEMIRKDGVLSERRRKPRLRGK